MIESSQNQNSWEEGRIYRTRNGVLVRSKIEKIIADFLFSEKIEFVYEPILEIKKRILRPDFYLPAFEGYYEHFGLNTPEYIANAKEKINFYRKNRINASFTTFADEPDIEEGIIDAVYQLTYKEYRDSWPGERRIIRGKGFIIYRS